MALTKSEEAIGTPGKDEGCPTTRSAIEPDATARVPISGLFIWR